VRINAHAAEVVNGQHVALLETRPLAGNRTDAGHRLRLRSGDHDERVALDAEVELAGREHADGLVVANHAQTVEAAREPDLDYGPLRLDALRTLNPALSRINDKVRAGCLNVNSSVPRLDLFDVHRQRAGAAVECHRRAVADGRHRFGRRFDELTLVVPDRARHVAMDEINLHGGHLGMGGE